MIPETDPKSNGVVREEGETPSRDAPDEAPTVSYEALRVGFDVDTIAREAEDVRDLVQRFQHDPVLFQVLQEQFQPLFDPLRRTLPQADLDEAAEDYPAGDTFNARALVQRHRHELRYCYHWKAWLTWSGTRWSRDETLEIWRWLRHIIVDTGYAMSQQEPEKANAWRSHVAKSLQTPRMEGTLKAAASWAGIRLGQEVFDTDPWLLNCANGTLDLRTATLRPHHPNDLLTRCLATPYDPGAACPTWEAFLKRIMGGAQGPDTPDMSAGELAQRQEADDRAQMLMDFHQRFVGYTLTGQTGEQCFCLLHGSGSNGKSTYLDTLHLLLGDYALSTPSASLLAKERHEGIPNDIARLRGARLVTAVEIGEGKRLNEELLKRLTGQDVVTARFLRAEFFDFKPEFKLLVACNQLPTIAGNDHAIWRRIHRVPFTVTIPDHEQDKGLRDKLAAELPGILAWAVRGCLAWQQQGLGVPTIVQEATTEYRSEQDQLGRFLEECCVRIDQASVKAGDLYDAYKDWCYASGEAAITLKAMSKRLDERGYTKTNSNYVWRHGLGLKDLHAVEEHPRGQGTQ